MKRLVIIVLLALALVSIGSLLLANTGADYTLPWLTIDGGGGTSQGGRYRLSLTMGQPDTAVMDSGRYTFSGGFWPARPVEGSLYLPITLKS